MENRTQYFSELYKQYYDMIFRICLDQLYYNVTNAEDVAEDVFITLLSKPRIEQKDTIKGWLILTAKNKIKEFKRNMVKRECQEDIQEFAETLAAPDADNMEEMLSEKANMLNLDEEIISSLRPTEQELLHYIREGTLTYSQIGEKMGLTEPKVTMRALRLYRKVQKMVEREIRKVQGL